MRIVVACVLALGVLLPFGAAAEPAAEEGVASHTAREAATRVRVGAAQHWRLARFHERVALGVGWSVPRRLYDADGRLLTERSLLFDGRDLERPGLYVALRF